MKIAKSDHDWIKKWFKKVTDSCNDECDDPRTALFRLCGVIVAALAQSGNVDVYRLASGVADNADHVLQNQGEIPPVKSEMQ